MKRHVRYSALVIVLGLGTQLLFAQQLTVEAAGKKTVLERKDVEALPHVKATTGSGPEATEWEGAPLKSVLEKAGVSFGESLRGKRLASCLVVEAADGYRVVIALPELDAAFTEKQVVLAYLRSGKPLDAKEGPYRIVIPDEKRMARWVRQVTKLSVVDVP